MSWAAPTVSACWISWLSLIHISVVRESVDKYLRGAPRVHLIDPLPADEMHNLMARCYLVLTLSLIHI